MGTHSEKDVARVWEVEALVSSPSIGLYSLSWHVQNPSFYILNQPVFMGILEFFVPNFFNIS
jgi:hypothetical protein